MAKIEIRGTAGKLDDIAIFLKNNNIEFSHVDDLIDRPSIDFKSTGLDGGMQPLK